MQTAHLLLLVSKGERRIHLTTGQVREWNLDQTLGLLDQIGSHAAHSQATLARLDVGQHGGHIIGPDLLLH